MSLKHAILGLLTFEPLTGYDLKTQYFDQSVAHFWPADQAQIYRALEQLKAEGWVTSELELQEGRPNRKTYAITPAGEAELQAWLQESRSLPPLRSAFLVQMYFARRLTAAEIISLLEDQIKQHRALLARYRQIPLLAPDDPTLARDEIFGPVTLDFGLRFEQMQIEWLEVTLALIKRWQHNNKG